jgi:NAD-reducing hydrogenase large subunit
MARKVVIDPVTRIEGHAKITIHLGEDGNVANAEFHVAEFRGFEKFCEGRPFGEMPSITARICGICPVSHQLASAKAGDRILATAIPPAAGKLRNLMNLGQIVQSHALSFFHLSSPDLLLGWDYPPAKRNVFGLIGTQPELARAGIRLRQFGQEIIEMLGGKKIHCAWAVPGGVRDPLTEENRQRIRNWLPESFKTAHAGLKLIKEYVKTHQQEVQIFGNFPTLFMSLVREDGTWEHHDGVLRIVDSSQNIIVDQFEPEDYPKHIGEAVQSTSYLKSPYYRPFGYPDGIYRVGPLARLNIAQRMGTPLADQELVEFRNLGPVSRTSSFLYHLARLIEILASLERIQALIEEPDALSTHLRADAGVNRLEAVGVSEAPRGTLFHHYKVDPNGILERINLIVATGNNNLAMNRTVTQIARHYIHGSGTTIPEPLLNRVEHGIRCYDPCLSCSTHALGQMPIEITLVTPDGTVLDRKACN